MQTLLQSTAAQVVYVYLTDITDGFTPEASVTTPTVYLSKNGGAAAVPESLAWAETDGTNMPGVYEITLSAVDTDTVGPLAIDVIKTGTSRHFVTVCYVSAVTLATIKAETALILADTGTDGVVLSDTVKNAIVDLIWDELTSGHAVAGSTGKALTSATAAADPWAVDPATYTTDNTFGKAIARAIGGSGFSASTITVQDADDVAVEAVRVDVYSASTPSTIAFVTTGTTNSSGQVSFYLRAGTYYIFRYKAGYSWTDPVTLTVT